MLFGFGLATLTIAASFQQEPPKASDTTRLRPVTVRESVKPAHRYSAAWSANATKTETPLRDTPQSVSVITRSLIAEQSMQSLADAIRYVPGVTMGQGEGHRDAPTMRGNSSTADFFVDGIRDDAQYFRDFYNVERVEVLAGSNAMIFGRGGGGGVINRLTKKARWEDTRDVTVEAGSFGHGRGTIDFGGAVTDAFAARFNGMYQNSNGFRDAFVLRRLGVNPNLAWQIGARTIARLGAEYFEDRRRVDRGLPSFQGRPSSAPLGIFFGNPDSSYAQAQVGGLDATVEHRASDRLSFRSIARATSYDKFYQNVFPAAVNAAGTQVNLSAYNHDMQRMNFFSQNELTLRFANSRVPQTLVMGVEAGRQATDNLRLIGYFNGTSTSASVPFDAPTVTTPVVFRPGPTDANNRGVVNVASVYVQDQMWLTSKVQATAGIRIERFALTYRDHRASEPLDRTDDVFSPRLGLVFKPVMPLSLYSSYSVSYLPSSGDQFAGLTVTTQTLEPERFANVEAGAKWEIRPELTLNAAVYELLRANSAAPSALDPGITVQTGRQRTRGVEASVSGSPVSQWDVIGSFTSQSARILSRTTAAPAGAVVPLVPRQMFSLWNRYQVTSLVAFGLGIINQSSMYAAIDNGVTLPGYWRADAAAYLGGFRSVKLQVNVENLLDERYYATSHGNNNIMPGAPRSLRLSLTTQVP